MIQHHEITSFDKTERVQCRSVRPEKYSDILRLKNQVIIARGAGLSYCNAAASKKAIVVDMQRMDKILEFDATNETITVEAGITIGELNNFLISKNFIFPVLPGYPTITIGGCIAFNVHGKSQFKVGTFCDWVKSITLFHPAKGELICSNETNADAFKLTMGGLGLTGIIMTATLSFKKLPGGRLESKKIFVKNLFEAIAIMQKHESEYEYVYSWNNLNKKKDSFGEGVIYLERYVSGTTHLVPYTDKMKRSYGLPSFHNSWTIKTMCNVYYLMEKIKGTKKVTDLMSGSFPIYHKEIYFYLFGKKGFREYQLLIPFDNHTVTLHEIRELIADMKIAIALGSLKLFNGKSHYLNFNGTGICLTMDVQNSNKALEFFNKLDSICERHKVTINLSKDSRVSAITARKLFNGYEKFKELINEFDSSQLITSELKERLDLQV